VAEDDPFLLELAGLLLESEGFSFATFRNAEEALRAFKAAPIKPRLIISDFSMGLYSMNGVDFLAECKRVAPGIKGFLVSGTVEEKSILVNGRPVDCFLSKPYNTTEFLRTVQELLRQTESGVQPGGPV
jgi:two-component system CheB/CheR fusion protein